MKNVVAALVAASALAVSAAPVAADETWTSDFGTLTYVDDLSTHGPAVAILSYPAGSNYAAGFVSLDNVANNTDNRGRSVGYWWTHGNTGRRCAQPFYDAYNDKTTHYYGQVVFTFTSPDWANSDFRGLYGECNDAPSLPWNGAHD